MASGAKSAGQLMEVVRAGCLKRGAHGIKGFGRAFRLFDDDGSKTLNKDEFVTGLQDYNIDLSKQEMSQLFEAFDTDRSGSLNFDEFLEHLRPPMSETRIDLIKTAFKKLDRTGDGRITVDDLKGCYNVRKNPKYLSGELTENECLKTFLDSFQVSGELDEKVTWDEFLNYYAGVSASIDEDIYFDFMMRQAWKL